MKQGSTMKILIGQDNAEGINKKAVTNLAKGWEINKENSHQLANGGGICYENSQKPG